MLKVLGRTAGKENKQFLFCCKVSLIQLAKLILMWHIVPAPWFCLLLPGGVIQSAQHFSQHRKGNRPASPTVGQPAWCTAAREHCRGKDNSSQGPCEGVEVIMVKAVEEQGESACLASLGSQKRVWNNLPPCHCVSPFLSARGKSQSLRRHPGVRLVRDDGWITKCLKKMKGSAGDCGRKSHFLSLKLSRIAHLAKQLHSSRNSPSPALPGPAPQSHHKHMDGFPLDKREEQQNMSNVNCGISWRNSDEAFTERSLRRH